MAAFLIPMIQGIAKGQGIGAAAKAGAQNFGQQELHQLYGTQPQQGVPPAHNPYQDPAVAGGQQIMQNAQQQVTAPPDIKNLPMPRRGMFGMGGGA